MEQGIAQVRRRLERAAAALGAAGVPYAVVGGNAVAAWFSGVDAAAVRNTRDVDILLRRVDLERARQALEGAGFVHRRVASLGKGGSMDVFLDGPEAKVRDAVHIHWAGERSIPGAIEATPALGRTEAADGCELIPLEGLLRMKLTSFRDKDRMRLRDLAIVGLVDATWLQKLSVEMARRLQSILDDPEGRTSWRKKVPSARPLLPGRTCRRINFIEHAAIATLLSSFKNRSEHRGGPVRNHESCLPTRNGHRRKGRRGVRSAIQRPRPHPGSTA